MSKKRILDLFCCQGGAGMGYSLAGFEVVGVDIQPQPRYPFEFHQGDALEFAAKYGSDFDAIHASPPCQGYSLGALWRGTKENHPDLVDATRQALQATGRPYIIENVPGAPLRKSVMLCGTMFGLKVIRHRHFEIHPDLAFITPPCVHRGRVRDGHYVTVAGHGGDGSNAYSVWADAMEIDWMDKYGLSQALPPVYTSFLGSVLVAVLEGAL